MGLGPPLGVKTPLAPLTKILDPPLVSVKTSLDTNCSLSQAQSHENSLSILSPPFTLFLSLSLSLSLSLLSASLSFMLLFLSSSLSLFLPRSLSFFLSVSLSSSLSLSLSLSSSFSVSLCIFAISTFFQLSSFGCLSRMILEENFFGQGVLRTPLDVPIRAGPRGDAAGSYDDRMWFPWFYLRGNNCGGKWPRCFPSPGGASGFWSR